MLGIQKQRIAEFILIVLVLFIGYGNSGAEDLPNLIIPGGMPSFNPQTVTAGKTVLVSGFIVRNQVEVKTSQAPACNIGIYLSKDETLSTESDRLLDSRKIRSLAGKDEATLLTSTITIPEDTEPGDYFLGVFIDYDNRVTESNEEDNTVTAAITITDTDLTPTVIGDGSILDGNSVIIGTVKDLVIEKGVFIDNSGGVIENATLKDDVVITGGRLTGVITGEGNAEILNAVIDVDSITGVRLGYGSVVTQKTVLNNPGLVLTFTVTGDGDIRDPEKMFFIDENGAEQTALSLLSTGYADYLGDPDMKIEVNDARGRFTISSDKLNGRIMPARVSCILASQSSNMVGLNNIGEVKVTVNGIESSMAPAGADEDAIVTGLEAIGVSTVINPDGVVLADVTGQKRNAEGKNIFIRDASKLSPTTRWLYHSTPGTGSGDQRVRIGCRFKPYAYPAALPNAFSAGTATFDLTIGDAALSTYNVLITYPDGATQDMIPFVHDPEAFEDIMTSIEATQGISYQIDPDSGIIDLMDAAGGVFWKLIPDFYIYDTPENVTEAMVQMAETAGGDLNNDALSDFYFITPNGKQILYSFLPEWF